MNIRHFTHIKLKPTKRVNINFNISKEIRKIDVPEKNKDFADQYLKSKKLLDEYDQDLMIVFENELIYGFDYLHNNQKIIIPEINPVTIFYSNAVMSHYQLISFKEELIKNSINLKGDSDKRVNPNEFGNFFRLASNCLINLQSSLESFANRLIPKDYPFIDKNEKKFEPTIFHKLDKVLPNLRGKKFKHTNKKSNSLIRDIIELRNNIVHLKPVENEPNTKYNVLYRKLLDFNYTEAIIAVEEFVNFYEEGLLEKCPCGREYYYGIIQREDD